MSIEAYQAVWANSRQTGGVKLTLLALAEYASPENDFSCWPGISRLAEMVGVSERQIQMNIVQLEKAGEITVRRSAGRGNTNEYDLSPVVKGEVNFTITEEEKVKSSAEKVKPSAEKVKSSASKGEAHFTQTIIEPLGTVKEPKETTPPTPPEPAGGEMAVLVVDGYRAVVKTYEQEIGTITKHVADKISEALVDFTPETLSEAIQKAAENNKRSWAYVNGILKRWQSEGRGKKAATVAAKTYKLVGDDGKPFEKVWNPNGHSGQP